MGANRENDPGSPINEVQRKLVDDICAEGGRPDLLKVREPVCGTRSNFTKYLALLKTEGTPSKKLAAVVLCCLIWRE